MAEELAPAGQWGTIQFTLPDFLEDIRDTINSVADFLLAFLDIALAALQLIKAFSKSYLDPIAALVQSIVDLVQSFIDSLRSIGLYITGDWGLLEYPFEDLKGGFPEYERRMIARLTDRQDPTRPDIPPTVAVLAAFFYLSVDVSNIQRAIEFVQQITSVFNLRFDPSGTPPVPVITSVEYGNDLELNTFQSLDSASPYPDTPPNKVRISWRLSETSIRSPFDPFPPAGPAGFRISVSTVQDGMKLYYSRPESNTDKQASDANEEKSQPREYGEVRDQNGQPVVLYTGGFGVTKSSDVRYNEAVQSGGGFKDGKSAVYAVIDPSEAAPIPVDDQLRGFYGQEYWYDNDGINLDFLNEEYSIVLDLEDLPNRARSVVSGSSVSFENIGKSDMYYVRIQSVSNAEVVKAGVVAAESNGDSPLAFDLSNASQIMDAKGPVRLPYVKGRTPSVHSAWSAPQPVTFPNANTKEYLEAVQAALAVLVLSRSDYPILTEASDGEEKGVALLPTGLEGFEQLFTYLYPDGLSGELEKASQDPLAFRGDLANRIRRVANLIYERTGPQPDIEEYVANNTTNLRTSSFRDILAASSVTMASQIASNYSKATLWDFLEERQDSQESTQKLVEILNQQTQELERLKQLEAEAGGFPYTPPPALKIEDFTNVVSPSDLVELGFAPNLFSVGIPDKDMDNLFYTEVIRGRTPDFIEVSDSTEEQRSYVLQPEVSAEDVPAVLVSSAPGLRLVYEKYIQEDGSIQVPTQVVTYINSLVSVDRRTGSGDMAPVFYTNREGIIAALDLSIAKADRAILEATDDSEIVGGQQLSAFGGNANFAPGTASTYFARTIFRNYEEGVLYDEARIALGLAGASLSRPAQDGEWIAIRLFDSFPDLDNFFSSVNNWTDTLSAAIQSVADELIEYVEYVEARIVEIQQLIRRINAAIQSVLNFTVNIPKCAGLLVVGKGTDGITAGLQTATNKPNDSPLAYGAGVAVVVPSVPSFFLDLIQVCEGGQDLASTITVNQPPEAIGVEAIEPGAGPAPTDEPDVL